MAKIGIMGGTFNPIHIGHLMLAECAREELKLDEVWFIPTGHSYMKEVYNGDCSTPGVAVVSPTPGERFEMTKLAIAGNPFFDCLDIETKRSGNTYTYETLRQLRAQYPEHEYYFIFGADCLYSIENWKCPKQIFEACQVVAAIRQDADIGDMQKKIKELQERFDAKILFLPFRNLEISSTDIRRRVGEGKSIRYITPDAVVTYINIKGFYRHESNGTQKDKKSHGEKP